MNSVANGKVTRMTPFRRVYVQAAAGDAGGAIGAAFAVWHKLGGKRDFVDGPCLLGAGIRRRRDRRSCSTAAAAEIAAAGCTVERHRPTRTTLCRRTAAAIADGKVVGWFQGRMEWGPRALGNRSILCDPRRADMKAHPQRQDQAARIVPPVRPLDPATKRCRIGSRRTTTCRS